MFGSASSHFQVRWRKLKGAMAMTSFDLAIVKVAAFCNINCNYCYMFNASDRTFEHVPRFMSEKIADRLIERIEQYLEKVNKRRFHLTLHGGEPTLWPKNSLRRFLARISAANARGFHISTSLQTNGFRFDHGFFEILSEYGVSVGVSLDGPAEFNDSRRVTHNGKGTYARVMTNTDQILRSDCSKVLHGFLAVADTAIPPQKFIEWVGSLPLTKIDILWPMDFHYGNPPWSNGSEHKYRELPIYGKWFSDVFDEWMRIDNPKIYVRHFFDCIERYLGSTRHIESIVNDKVPMFVVNTDGQYEYHDYFRPHANGMCRTSMNIDRNAVADLHEDQMFKELMDLSSHLPDECQHCGVREICGGGFLPGRVGSRRHMPRSILCHDQNFFFSHVHDKLQQIGVFTGDNHTLGDVANRRPLLH
jgi:uncharacterized protein